MKRFQRYLAALLTSVLTLPAIPVSAEVAAPPSALPAIFKVQDYGSCTWDSGHDVGACIDAAITAANAAGGGTVIVPIGTYGLSTTVAGADKVKVAGAGGANYDKCATKLVWIGAASGVMAAVGSDASASQVVGAGLSKMCLDGATLAGTGLKLRSVVWSDFEDLYVSRVTANAYDLDVSSTANIGVMFNKFIRTYADLADASAASANGWKIGPGSTTANTNRNIWVQPIVNYQNGTGFICGNMDSNEVVGAGVEPVGGGSGTSLDLLGHASSVLRTCRSNRFAGMFGVTGSGAVVAEAGSNPSLHNTLYLDQESGAPNPTINSGASLLWSSNLGPMLGGWNLNLPKYGGGCTLSNDGTTPNTVIDIDACATADDSANVLMIQTAAYTKTTGSWAAGSGNGCLDTGSVGNSTWYYLFQIQRSDTNAADYLCSTSYSAPTMPASYNRKRYIGAIKTDGSAHILAFKQTGDEFVWGSVIQDVAIFNLGTTSQLVTLASVPGSHKVQAHVRAEIFATGNPKLLLTSPDEADVAIDTPQGQDSITAITSAGTPTTLRLLTNASQQVRAIGSQASTSLWIITAGWRDPAISWAH